MESPHQVNGLVEKSDFPSPEVLYPHGRPMVGVMFAAISKKTISTAEAYPVILDHLRSIVNDNFSKCYPFTMLMMKPCMPSW